MKIRRTKPTMKQQLFLFFMLAAVLVCLIFSAYYFVSEQRVLRNNLERENTKNLQYAIEKIEENAMRVEKFANQICQNGQIRALMLADDPFAPAETMAVASMLDEQFQFVTVTEDILSLYLIGENGLDIRRGKEAALVDRDAVYRAVTHFSQTAALPAGAAVQIIRAGSASMRPYCRIAAVLSMRPPAEPPVISSSCCARPC